VYRFLITARWLGLAALTIALVGLMVLAGRWQLDRYHERSAVNARIDAARAVAPAPLRDLLPPAQTPRAAGRPAQPELEWSRVGVTGRYDGANQILARSRTLGGQVGFEVVTPLVLDDGTAVLVDRGWLPAPRGDAATRPAVPAPPAGDVTISGRIARSESRPGPLRRDDDVIEVRRIAVDQLAAELPYPVYGSYVLLDAEQPGGDEALTAVPSRRENAWQNAGYVVQWWLFALLTVVAFGWLVRREAAGPTAGDERDLDRAAGPVERPLAAR
jgi:cytochrome oxidase assembly protein ShyY1